MEVVLPPWRKLINKSFIPLIKNRVRYLICIGGRGSSKSDFVAKKLIYRCLNEPFFRFVLYRKTYNTIKDSQFQNIKDIIYEWGLESLFVFTESPLQIRCVNGNKFICRGGDDPLKLKSIKDPTGVWYEEEIPPEADFLTISTSIRTKKAAYLQEIFSVNPEVEGDYKEHWFYKRFFAGKPEGTCFTDSVLIKLPAIGMLPEREVLLDYTVHHSTYKDNRWLPDVFIAMLLDLEKKNPYYYTIYVLGLWGNKTTDGNFYKLFNRVRTVKPKDQCRYNPALPLLLTFDFNVHPYVTLNIHQLQPGGKVCKQIDEICFGTPQNRTDKVCQEFMRRYRTHRAGVSVFGDPSGKHEDTRTEVGYNDFLIIQRELITFRPQMRYQEAAPHVVPRGMFINAIFADDAAVDGLEIQISESCTNTIADYGNLKEAADGTKAKIRIKNKETGVTYEQYGHTSDANDYLYCVIWMPQFIRYQKGSVIVKGLQMGKATSKNSY